MGCLVSWKSPIVIGVIIGTLLILIGANMTVNTYVYGKGTSNDTISGVTTANPSLDKIDGTTNAPVETSFTDTVIDTILMLDGPILMAFGGLSYIIGGLVGLRKYKKFQRDKETERQRQRPTSTSEADVENGEALVTQPNRHSIKKSIKENRKSIKSKSVDSANKNSMRDNKQNRKSLKSNSVDSAVSVFTPSSESSGTDNTIVTSDSMLKVEKASSSKTTPSPSPSPTSPTPLLTNVGATAFSNPAFMASSSVLHDQYAEDHDKLGHYDKDHHKRKYITPRKKKVSFPDNNDNTDITHSNTYSQKQMSSDKNRRIPFDERKQISIDEERQISFDEYGDDYHEELDVSDETDHNSEYSETHGQPRGSADGSPMRIGAYESYSKDPFQHSKRRRQSPPGGVDNSAYESDDSVFLTSSPSSTEKKDIFQHDSKSKSNMSPTNVSNDSRKTGTTSSTTKSRRSSSMTRTHIKSDEDDPSLESTLISLMTPLAIQDGGLLRLHSETSMTLVPLPPDPRYDRPGNPLPPHSPNTQRQFGKTRKRRHSSQNKKHDNLTHVTDLPVIWQNENPVMNEKKTHSTKVSQGTSYPVIKVTDLENKVVEPWSPQSVTGRQFDERTFESNDNKHTDFVKNRKDYVLQPAEINNVTNKKIELIPHKYHNYHSHHNEPYDRGQESSQNNQHILNETSQTYHENMLTKEPGHNYYNDQHIKEKPGHNYYNDKHLKEKPDHTYYNDEILKEEPGHNYYNGQHHKEEPDHKYYNDQHSWADFRSQTNAKDHYLFNRNLQSEQPRTFHHQDSGIGYPRPHPKTQRTTRGDANINQRHMKGGSPSVKHQKRDTITMVLQNKANIGTRVNSDLPSQVLSTKDNSELPSHIFNTDKTSQRIIIKTPANSPLRKSRRKRR